MCGIAGLMRREGQPPDPAVLARLAGALAHRGPDGSGTHIEADTGLVQTRLAIIDLATGDQPFYGPGRLALVANGEVYNYQALREALGPERFRTRSDCEPPLALYADEGEAGLDRLRGMYALALHDAARGRLLLARDPFGIKPLYYAEGAHGLAFASEPQALIDAGLASRTLISEKAVELLQLQFTTGRQTIYRDICRVLPGETLVAQGGRIVSRRRRPALPAGAPEPWDEAEALSRLEQALRESVRLHLQSDVGYGLFLSGGIDSSLLLALMAAESGRPVQAYTAGFPGTGVHDERAQAAAFAAECGAVHREVTFGEADFWTLLPQAAAALDDPAADYATLPTFKLASVAAQEQKVVLSGEGGDELFAGYGRYRKALRPWWRGGRALRSRGALDRSGVLRLADGSWRTGVGEAEAAALAGNAGRSRLQVAQAADCADWLPNDLLIKLDRCLMAHGLEGRTPYLDPQVAGVAFRLPDGLKVRGRTGKWLQRKLLQQYFPRFDAFAPKRGFTVPVAEWIRARDPVLASLVASQPGIAELCHPGKVQAVFAAGGKHAGQAAWSLLFYALWHHIHALGRAPGPTPEETLGQR